MGTHFAPSHFQALRPLCSALPNCFISCSLDQIPLCRLLTQLLSLESNLKLDLIGSWSLSHSFSLALSGGVSPLSTQARKVDATFFFATLDSLSVKGFGRQHLTSISSLALGDSLSLFNFSLNGIASLKLHIDVIGRSQRTAHPLLLCAALDNSWPRVARWTLAWLHLDCPPTRQLPSLYDRLHCLLASSQVEPIRNSNRHPFLNQRPTQCLDACCTSVPVAPPQLPLNLKPALHDLSHLLTPSKRTFTLATYSFQTPRLSSNSGTTKSFRCLRPQRLLLPLPKAGLVPLIVMMMSTLICAMFAFSSCKILLAT